MPPVKTPARSATLPGRGAEAVRLSGKRVPSHLTASSGGLAGQGETCNTRPASAVLSPVSPCCRVEVVNNDCPCHLTYLPWLCHMVSHEGDYDSTTPR